MSDSPEKTLPCEEEMSSDFDDNVDEEIDFECDFAADVGEVIDDDNFEGNFATEEELMTDFDKEADLIIQKDTLPEKSADRYLLVYYTYNKWKGENQKSLSMNEENNLIVYFKMLRTKVCPKTLWCVWSMLCKTLSTQENVQINNFLRLKNYIKITNKGYRSKKAEVLRWLHIEKFMNEAPE